MTHKKTSKETQARIRLVEDEAARTFGSPELARQWMAKRNLALGCAPIEMLDSESGLTEVRRVLVAIGFGGAV